MTKLLLSFFTISFSSLLMANTAMKLKFQVQKSNLKTMTKTLELDLNDKTQKTIYRDSKTKLNISKIIKNDTETLINIDVIEGSEVVSSSEIALTENNEAQYQTFNSDGSNDIKILIKED